MTVVFELVGPPGSGKSAAAALVIDQLSAQGVDVVTLDELEAYRSLAGDRFLNRCNPVTRAWQLRRFWGREVGTGWRVAWVALRHAAIGRKRWRKARRPLTNRVLIDRLQMQFPDRVVLLDDGFLQKLWSLAIGVLPLAGMAQIEELLRDYYAATGVRCIRLEVDDATAQARVFTRDSRGRFNQAAGERFRIRSQRWFAEHRRMVDCLPASALVGTVDAGAPLASVANEITARILTSLSVAPGADLQR